MRSAQQRCGLQLNLAEFIANSSEGEEAQAILRKCVHCGFCNATCPTYQLLGDELDGPRGRIYLIKEMLEGAVVSEQTQLHLDRCLTCRACETTCPSGVEYGRLLDVGRAVASRRIRRKPLQALARRLLRTGLSATRCFDLALRLGRRLRPWLPVALREMVPLRVAPGEWPTPRHARRMLVLDGCVQQSIAPHINSAAARVLDALGISLLRVADTGCCGAMHQHLDAQSQALVNARRNIDAWWPLLEQGAESIVMTASGCGVMVKDYGHLLRDDARYALKAARVSALTRDLAEVIAPESQRLSVRATSQRVAFQSPCTLQHGQRLGGLVEGILQRAGYELAPVADAHLCCGSAGTYSILQPELSARLRENKLHALQAAAPQQIVTANIGCLTHLQARAQVPVRHWIELLDL